LRAVLGAHLLDRVGVLLLPTHAPAHEGVENCGANHLLLLRGEALPYVAVDDQLEHRVALVHAGRVVILPDLRQAEPQVLDAADPFRAIDHPTLRRGHDLAAGHVDRLHAHALVDLGHDASLAAFHALEIGEA